jgi:periplasmic protein TonB
MISGYELKDELARFCLPEANRDPNRKLAWMNSICILFLLIGISGARPAAIPPIPLPPLEELVPAMVEPLTPTPQTVTEQQNEDQADQEQSDVPKVVVVTPAAPNINFAIPTIGNLVVPTAVAKAPPLKPMQAPAPLRSVPRTLSNTGAGGERPAPPYPKLAQQQGEQGTVTLLLKTDEAGAIISVEVKESSGFPILDRSSVDYVRRHWKVPNETGTHVYEATIIYKLQAG